MANPQCRPHRKWMHVLGYPSLAMVSVFLGSGHSLWSEVSRRQMLKPAVQLAPLLICGVLLERSVPSAFSARFPLLQNEGHDSAWFLRRWSRVSDCQVHTRTSPCCCGHTASQRSSFPHPVFASAPLNTLAVISCITSLTRMEVLLLLM